jgi:hypothetical protein
MWDEQLFVTSVNEYLKESKSGDVFRYTNERSAEVEIGV